MAWTMPRATLTDRDLERFASNRRPSLELLKAAKVERVSDRDARERFGIQGPSSKNMAGIVFPYYSHVTRLRVTARVRRDNPELEDGLPKNKYVSAYGDARHLYFPPGAAENLRKPESAFALVGGREIGTGVDGVGIPCGHGLAAGGHVGGCWGWRGRIGRGRERGRRSR